MRSWRIAAVPVLALALMAGCEDNPSDPMPPTAELRLLNGATGVAALDLLVDGMVVAAAVPYEGSSNYAEVPAGSQEVAVRETGTANIVGTLDTMLVADGDYTLMAGGSALRLVTRSPGDTGQAKPDRANIRIVNIAPAFTDSASVPPPVPLDVHITAPGTDLAGRQAELSLDARYPSYSTLLYFDPGTWVVRFTEGGTATVVAQTGLLSIGAGEVRAVMLEKPEGGDWTVAVVAE
ncbi:MAG TPA: DUF4397 domain-containing protein [Gemmatimonadales bacterium]|nr:DUF4397 domain-containing protein [Gemmatimonadales bacterium]